MDPLAQAKIRELRGEIADIEALRRDMLEFLPRIRDAHARRLWQFRVQQVLEAASERSAALRDLEAAEQDAPGLCEPVLDLGAQLVGCETPGELAEVEILIREALAAAPLIHDPYTRRLWKAQTARVLRQAVEKRALLDEAEPAAPPVARPAAASWLLWLTPALGTLLCAAVAVAATFFGRGWERASVLPLVFLGVVLTAARYFGSVVGILGCVLSSAIFALYLFPPFGSFVIEDQTALTSLGVLVSGGASLSYYVGGRLAARRPFVLSAPS